LAAVLPRVIDVDELDAARERLRAGAAGGGAHDMHAHASATDAEQPWRTRIRSMAGWADASGYAISDITMLRKELVIGFVAAGFAAIAVPMRVWQALFLTGHGFWSALENVVVGPVLAFISFVCSIGNVPLAAALWIGGISFGGVISFVFADLITLPLLLIYRKYYGTRLTLRLLAVFWVVMSVAGLATEYVFRALRLMPAVHPQMIAMEGVAWNYTTILNIIALAAFGVLYWLYRGRERFGGGAGYAKDPICGMQIETVAAPATVARDGQRHYFCSDHCRVRFTSAAVAITAASPRRPHP
ncbi:MAG: uncharacterized protein QOG46_2826, partial [Pseudonocardiales bacterium]|nr:uncharacterized protein [Pseudonocardiales bacterium]